MQKHFNIALRFMIYNGQITELPFKKKAFRFSSKGFINNRSDGWVECGP